MWPWAALDTGGIEALLDGPGVPGWQLLPRIRVKLSVAPLRTINRQAHARTVSAMSVMGVMFGSLKEQHADHIILSDSTRIRLADGLVLEQFGSGTRVTITYRRDRGGEMVVESVQRSAMPKVRPDHLP